MDREELLKQKDKLQKELDKLTELISKKDIRFKPGYGEFYYYLDSLGFIQRTYWNDGPMDSYRYSVGNCFKTEQEAYGYKENLITKQQLKDLALELNNGVEIDWSDDKQLKFYIYLGKFQQDLDQDNNIGCLDIGQVYCIDESFLDVAKERIGEEKLINLIKSGV